MTFKRMELPPIPGQPDAVWAYNLHNALLKDKVKTQQDIETVQTAFDGKFDPTTGHKHTGAAGDGPKIDPTTGLTYVPVNKAGDTMTGLLAFSISLPSGVNTSDTPDKWPSAGFAEYSVSPGTLQNQPSSYGKILHFAHSSVKHQFFLQWIHPLGGVSGNFWYRHAGEGDTVWGQWHTVWHAGNDGAGSGLDADLLDGKHASEIAAFRAGESLLHSNDTARSTTSTSYVKVKETRIGSRGGTFRIRFALRHIWSTYYVYGKVYRNGTPVGIEHSVLGDTWVTVTEDIAGWAPDDYLQVYLKVDSGTGYVQDLKLYVTESPVAVL